MQTNETFDYEYPNGLNLHPSSELHDKLVKLVMEKAEHSSSHMSGRYREWQKIDDSLDVYVELTQKEKDAINKNKRTPVSITVPVNLSILETILSYLVSTFINDPLIRYDSVSPEDTPGVILLEKVIDLHCKRAKVALNLHTLWRDSLVYGLGVAIPVWDVKIVNKKSMYEGIEIVSESVLFEGNKLINIDPYNFLPDPSVSVTDVQNGEFVGWVEHRNYVSLRRQENNKDFFNVRYLKDMTKPLTTKVGLSSDSGVSYKQVSDKTSGTIDVIFMYIDLIPKDHKLSDKEEPEKWLFGVAGDKLLIAAEPLTLSHGKFPVVTSAPDFDGYSVSPLSRMETQAGLQDIVNFLFNSHVANIRKTVNNLFVVDPSMINMFDLDDADSGGFIRLRYGAWGRDVRNSIYQLNTSDITRQNMADVASVFDLMNRTSGASDIVQGVIRGGERRSATEARGAITGAVSKLDRIARMIGTQAGDDIGYMFASNVQQFMTKEVYVKVLGRWTDEMIALFGQPINGYVKASPSELQVNYDVVSYTGSAKGVENADLWVQLLDTASRNPALASSLNIPAIFRYTAQLLGAKNIDDFTVKQAQQVMPQPIPMENMNGNQEGTVV